MSDLTSDLAGVKAQIAGGDCASAAALLSVYVSVKPSLRRAAKARMPALIFNNYPEFRKFDPTVMLRWAPDAGEVCAREIEDVADDPTRLPMAVARAVELARAAHKAA